MVDESEGNTGSNTPSDADKARLREHHVGWHPRGGWCRKFPGDPNRTYFGKVSAAEAVRLCILEEERRLTGQQAEARLFNLRVGEALNLFLNHLDGELASGKIGPDQRARYGKELDLFIRAVGKNRLMGDFCNLSAPELFKPLRNAAMERGVFAAEKHVVMVRTFLDWCSTVRRLMPAPFYADAFDAPSAKEKHAVRKANRKAYGLAFWTPSEVREIVDAARKINPHFYAQILLVLNGGMGNSDLSHLTDADVDWERRCIHTDRSKTLVPRVVPLWDVTMDAMRASRKLRPTAAKPQWRDRFFLTPAGKPLVTRSIDESRQAVKRTDAVRNQFYLMLNGGKRKRWKSAAIRLPHLKRHRAGFYSLRAVFATLSLGHGQDRNLEAIILGQQFDRPILEYYIRDEQRQKLRLIVEHVYCQIFQ